MTSASVRWLLVIVILLPILTGTTAQVPQRPRPRPHFAEFETLWPLHWVSAVYVWGFLKLGFIVAALLVLLAYRTGSTWKDNSIIVDHGAPVYHFRGIGPNQWESAGFVSLNDEVLYWSDRIRQVIDKF